MNAPLLRISNSLLLVVVSIFSLFGQKADTDLISEPKVDTSYFHHKIGLIENFPLYIPKGNTVYIDPTVNDNDLQNGTVTHPYNSFSDFNFVTNYTYAIKRGTTINFERLDINKDGITICSYGTSDQRPVLQSTRINNNAIYINGQGASNITIRDVEVYAPQARSCVRFGSKGDNLKLINCNLHDSYWGFRSIDATNVQVLNCEIHSVNDDGMFVQYCENVEISNCYVHDVNKNWISPSTPETEAAGDGIQLDKCNHWHVHHNLIDRNNSGNKFCFISNNPEQNDGVFEFNRCIGPVANGSSVYLHDGNGIIVRYNYLDSPAGSPVYSHGNNVLIHHNIITNIGKAIYLSKSGKIYNNVIYGFTLAFYGENLEIANNILVPDRVQFWIFKSNKYQASNNLIAAPIPIEGIQPGKPMFVDAPNHDFHLKTGSACIDKGKDVNLLLDFDGKKIPRGKAPDIGVYEY